MKAVNKESFFADIPLFVDLSTKEKMLLEGRSTICEYKKGEIIYREASPADAFYCVILGRVLVYTESTKGGRRILEHLHRGRYFGIISLLTGETHSVTAEATNDCSLLVIKQEDFDFMLKKIPRLAIDLSQTLSRRLKNKDLHQKTIFESTIISVFSSYAHAGRSIYALNLALSIRKESRKSVALLDIVHEDKSHSMPQRLEAPESYKVFDLSSPQSDPLRNTGDFIIPNKFDIDLICLSYKRNDDSCVKKLLGVLSILVNDYHYIVLDLPVSMDNSIFGILNQSDQIHLLTGPDSLDLKSTRNLASRLKKDFGFQENKIKIIINEYRQSKLSESKQRDILDSRIFANLPRIESDSTDRLVLEYQDCEYARAVRRISRQVSDSLVGLVLGVGVGYGFCHIGVLKVIEEEKIPIDIISGASIGAVIASLWAAGKTSLEILQIAQEFERPKYMWNLLDLTLPTLGFIKGKKLYEFLKRHLKDKTFQDLKLPLKIIASDLRKKQPLVFEKGPLVEALMASCSMPGVFRPFGLKKGLLVDGGIINPLPTEVLFKAGVKKIIAVNVTPSREDIINQYAEIKDQISATASAVKKREWFNLKKYFRERFKTNILDIIFSSIEVMQSEIVRREAQLADIVLHPDTSRMHWLELHRCREFAKRGEEEARKHLDKIWQVIND